ncbi:hypothetical protein N7G274_004080 [Stereocaulon virgatum]|uniref:Uncharacterized protein n=1 Tax=Stereocaulon virgatum TaxID=373712 RepID=A0ABR4ADQ6_9LECA
MGAVVEVGPTASASGTAYNLLEETVGAMHTASNTGRFIRVSSLSFLGCHCLCASFPPHFPQPFLGRTDVVSLEPCLFPGSHPHYLDEGHCPLPSVKETYRRLRRWSISRS